jgi:phospholipase/carboxylesterase
MGAGGSEHAVAYEGRGFYRLDVPEGLPAQPAACVVALHGYGQPPEEMADYARRVAPAHAVVLAPEGPLSFYREPRDRERQGSPGPMTRDVGFGWVADPRREDGDARNARLLEAVWHDAAARRPLDARRTVVLGFSQGVGVAVHWLLEHPGRAAGLVALAGGVRVPLRPRLGTLAGLPTLWITGRRDHAYPPAYAAELLPLLHAAGLDLRHEELGCGHGVPVPAAGLVREWLAARLV